uniref:Uncharacterized protein n=1 Tax=Lygus hesperus TaxID=30085 RepID=A0A146LNZ5_LYGHE
MEDEFRSGHISRLNRLKKNDLLSELRNFGFSNTLSKKNDVNTAAVGMGFMKVTKQPPVVPLVRSQDLKLNKYKQQKDVKGSNNAVGKENRGEHYKDEAEAERVTRELRSLQNQWEDQDIRTESPPWSNSSNPLSDSTLSTPAPNPSIIVSSPQKSPKPVDFSSTLGVAPLESTLVRKNEFDEEGQDVNFIELQSLVAEETHTHPQSLDLSTVLGTASLGVDTVELLDKPNMSMTKTSWGAKFRSPLLAVTEEPEPSLVGDENVPPDHADNLCSPVVSSGSDKVTSEVASPGAGTPNLFKEFQDRLVDLTLKIQNAEEKRLQAEKERRCLEIERKKVFDEFFSYLEQNRQALTQQVAKRRKVAPNSTKKSRPSVVASKLHKKDLRIFTPKDIGSYSRTPSQISGAATSKLVPFTPRSLRKNLNQQFNSIFGS